MYIYLIFFIIILIFIWNKHDTLNDIEFISTTISLCFILYKSVNKQEYFENSGIMPTYTIPDFTPLYSIPEYVNEKISNSLQKLTSSMKSGDDGKDPQDQQALTPEIFYDDPDVTQNNNINTDKYNTLVQQYLALDKVFDIIRVKNPELYKSIMNS